MNTKRLEYINLFFKENQKTKEFIEKIRVLGCFSKIMEIRNCKCYKEIKRISRLKICKSVYMD